jgi:tRNA threonylcarbamoyladenosine biosynthesis protein TsaE
VPFDKTVTITSHTPQQTEQIGSLLGSMLDKGAIIALTGELGTGKTTLVRGIGRGLAIEEGEVVSPSFTLVNEYEGPLRLFHIDLYRLADERELIGIDYEEYLKADGVVVIEWADRIPQAIPPDALWIMLRYLNGDSREIVLRTQGDRYKMIIEELRLKVYTEFSS